MAHTKASGSNCLKIEPKCNGLQDTPGIYEEGAVADAVTSFVKKGAKEYMDFEQARPASPPQPGLALCSACIPLLSLLHPLLSHIRGAVVYCTCLTMHWQA